MTADHDQNLVLRMQAPAVVQSARQGLLELALTVRGLGALFGENQPGVTRQASDCAAIIFDAHEHMQALLVELMTATAPTPEQNQQQEDLSEAAHIAFRLEDFILETMEDNAGKMLREVVVAPNLFLQLQRAYKRSSMKIKDSEVKLSRGPVGQPHPFIAKFA